MIDSGRARRVAAVLFVVSAALFVLGVVAEDDPHTEPTSEPTAGQAGGAVGEVHEEGGKNQGAEADEGAGTGGEEPGHHESSAEDTVLGVDAESPLTVTLAVLVSVALAAGLWMTKHRWVAVAAVVVGVLFAAFDGAEVTHQLDESKERPGCPSRRHRRGPSRRGRRRSSCRVGRAVNLTRADNSSLSAVLLVHAGRRCRSGSPRSCRPRTG
ncbi:MAG: hypothetical protein ABWZ13_00935 [Acidimicrobiales bacterium]